MAIPRKYRKRRLYTRIGIAVAATLVLVVGLIILIPLLETQVENGARTDESGVELPDYVERDLLVPNEYSRPGDSLTKINGIVIHYVGNPGSTAKNNRDYFNNLALTKATYASSHFIVGLEGEVIQCIPLNEIAYASNSRNEDTISIENCHPDETGEFNDVTYASLVKLAGWLCFTYDLEEDEIIRHYDVKGKLCPLYYVEHEDAWTALKADIMAEKARLALEESEISSEK